MKVELKKVDAEKGIVQITTTDERWYQIGEIFLPSVTWICSFYPKGKRFWKWVADMGWDEAEALKQEAADKGSKVHAACSDALQGKEVKIDAKYVNNSMGQEEELTPVEYGCVMSFVDFLNEYQPEILGFDYTLTNQEFGYAGTVDFKCRLNSDNYEHVWIVDIKTSKDVWPSMELQVSAYKHADKGVTKIAILQVGYERNKNKKFKLTEIDDKFELFLSARSIWQEEVGGISPLQKDYPMSVMWSKKRPVAKAVPVKVETPQGKPKKVVRRKLVKKKA